MFAHVRIAFVLLLAMTLLTGVVYPLFVTAAGQALFNDRANGSLLLRDGRVRGSALIGQSFSDAKYFWPRPSATGPMPYNAASSSGSNLALSNPAWTEAIQTRVAALRSADPGNTAPVPIDLVTTSASGLDPHISPAAARCQAARVARARGLSVAAVERLIDHLTEPRQWGILGAPRVNVLRLNLELDHPGWGFDRPKDHSWKDPI